jgi:Restriction endonuclease
MLINGRWLYARLVGSYATLTIGAERLSWKYYVPPVMTFLFAEEDFLAVQERIEPGDEDDPALPPEDLGYEVLGYRTTREGAISNLETYGYTLDFFARVYEDFYDELDAAARESVQADMIFSQRSDAEIEQYITDWFGDAPRSPRRDIDEFVLFLGQQRTDGRRQSPAERFEDIQSVLMNRHRAFSPATLRLAQFFEEDIEFDYGEVVLLMHLRLLLEAADPGCEVLLNLQDIAGAMADETPEFARKLFGELGQRLADKVSLYDRVFAVLFDREEDVREQYARTTARHILRDTPAVSSQERGRSLEELMRVIFGAPAGLEVFKTRYSTGDEEIDLVIKNNVDRPFWAGLDSPLLFVECKNWSSSVGASEVRDFEVKLMNHNPLARLGFFVAPGGFTSGARTELRRAGRSEYTVVLVDGAALLDYAESGVPTIEWLERLIAQVA